jgi:hypothetical protein
MVDRHVLESCVHYVSVLVASRNLGELVNYANSKCGLIWNSRGGYSWYVAQASKPHAVALISGSNRLTIGSSDRGEHLR